MKQPSLGQLLLAVEDRELDVAIQQLLAKPRSEHDSKTRADAIAFFDGVRHRFTAEILTGHSVTPAVIERPVDWAVMPPDREMHVLWRDFQRWARKNGLRPVVFTEERRGTLPRHLLTVRSRDGLL